MANVADLPAHLLLAEVGKRVLRPGGKELTLELIDALEVGPDDDVVEFAPGTGFTAERVLKRSPRSYTGVELNRDAAADLEERLGGPGREIAVGDAAETDLPNSTADAVYGEAMLTMHPDEAKASIVAEASRLLRPGGRYGIHELAVVPDEIDSETKAEIQRDLAAVTRVNARPLTESEWIDLLSEAGLTVTWRSSAPMHLLRPRRVVDDEGLLRTMRIGATVATKPAVARRILSMRRAFDDHKRQMEAIALVAEKQ
ncbi:methyltransferase domain-containing protein [Natrarchaeobius sp. A-rgal3]|uniref:class I SAM-dependent methyltransferase n=1 Tax=Natrarchaeobius versutus TaxID=1679078 RepID=UPI00351003B8